MNDDYSDLETDLRALQPLRPAASLEERIAQGLHAPTVPTPPANPWWRQLGFYRPAAAFAWGLATPAAAACAVLFLHASGPAAAQRSSAPAKRPAASESLATSGFGPAAASDVVYQTNDEGVVYDADQQPARRVRYRSEETLAWSNPDTGAQVEVSYPREEVVQTRISLR